MKRLILTSLLMLGMIAGLLSSPGQHQAADTRCAFERKTCHDRAEFIVTTCVIVYGPNSSHCSEQGAAYEESCLERAGCL